MNESSHQNFALIRGGLYGQRDTRSHVMRMAALELRERIVALLLGKRKSRRLECVQKGATNPLGGPVKLAAELQAARVGYAETRRAVIVPQERAIARMYGRHFDTGEFRPAA